MILCEPYRTQLREALAEHRRWAERAEQSDDLEAIKECLAAAWTARIRAHELITDGEAETRRQAIAEHERKTAA
jgi:hypothetical protein